MAESREYSLSHPQKRILYSQMRYPVTSFANLAGSVIFSEEVVDFVLLEKAINGVVERYDALRIRLRESVDYEVKQYVSNVRDLKLEVIEKAPLKEWMLLQSRMAFSLFDSDLFYFALVNGSDNRGGYYFKFHHIICDAMSVSSINRQINKLYKALVARDKPILEGDIPSYIEFLDREQQYLGGEQYQADKAFWLNEFKDIPEAVDFEKQGLFNHIQSERKVFNLGEALTGKIDGFCKENNTTVFRFLMAVFYVYFFRTTGNQDLVLGTGHHNRVSKRERDVVGMTVSTVPVRVTINAEMDFLTHLKVVTEKVTHCLAHQSYPFDLLVADLRENGCEPGHLLNIMLNHIPSQTGDYLVERYTPGCDPGMLNIKINPNQLAQGHPLEIGIDYRIELFHAEDIDGLMSRLEVLIKDILTHPNKQLSHLEIMPEDEQDWLLHQSKGPYEAADHEGCFHSHFREQALKTPNNQALVFKDQSYTYGQLNHLTDQLAETIRSKGIKPDDKVAIMTERSAEFVIGLLAVFKVGAAYLPIDPSSPQERIDFMLTDSQALLLLSQKTLKDKALHFKGEWVDLWDETAYTECKDESCAMDNPTDAAYVLYTSGTSGTPKGVVIEHKSLYNFCVWYRQFYELTEGDHQAAFCNFTFDVSLGELLPPLLVGATVHILPEEIRLSPEAINQYFEEERISVACFPTRVGEIFTEATDNQSLRVLTLVGERLQKVKKSSYKIVNAYGPTEATIYATATYLQEEADHISIGKPLPNTWAYVVDKQGRLLPRGMAGELWLSGVQIAREYLNLKQLTHDKFSANPFATSEQNQRIYKTGDLVRWLPDGNLDFIGRRDGQVKIRGFRIEFSEIESQLMQMPDVKEAVVLGPGINAFVVLVDPIDLEALKIKLRLKLPDCMIPDRIIQVQSIPLTPTGKTDQVALGKILAMEIHKIQEVIVAAKTVTEQKVLTLWTELLQLKEISVTKSFFDLGGNSLLAIRMSVMIKKNFQLNLPVSILYGENTIEKLARVIDGKNTGDHSLVVCLQKGQGKDPLFCIHDFSGEVIIYYNMVNHLKDDQALYGIRYPRDFDPRKQNLEALAAEYIKQMKTVHPRGPYRLVGYSAGGIIAYEMAQQLLEQNEQVQRLALLDTPNYRAYPKSIEHIFRNVARYAFNWLGVLSFRDKLRFARVGFAGFEAQKSMQLLLSGYLPKKYKGKLILFKASKRRMPMDQYLGWHAFAQSIEVYEISGNHVSIINEENFKKIVEVITNE